MQVKFLVQGSTDHTYRIIFTKRNNEVDITCNCQLVETATPCEHHISILDDETENIVCGNEEDVATIKEWLCGSMLGKLYDKYKDADKQYLDALDAKEKVDTAKTQLYNAKNRLSCQVKVPTTYEQD